MSNYLEQRRKGKTHTEIVSEIEQHNRRRRKEYLERQIKIKERQLLIVEDELRRLRESLRELDLPRGCNFGT